MYADDVKLFLPFKTQDACYLLQQFIDSFLILCAWMQDFPVVLIVVGHFLDSFLCEVNFIWWKLDSSYWKFLLDVPNKGAIESNSLYIKFNSRKNESIKCPTAMRTPQKSCNDLKHAIDNCFTISFHRIKHPIEFDYSLAGRALRLSIKFLWFRIDVGPKPKCFGQQIVEEWIESTLVEHFDRTIYFIPYPHTYYMDRMILYSQWQDSLKTGLLILI